MDSAYVLDSYALISYLENEPGEEKVERILKAAHLDKTRLYLSVINLGEVYYITKRERGIEKANETIFIIEQLPISIIDADKGLTLSAAKIKAGHSVSYADCFVAALANQKKAKVVTGDPEFKKLEKDVAIEWL